MKRRLLFGVVTLILATAMLGFAQQGGKLKVHSLAKDVYWFEGGGGNAVLIVGDNGSIVIDTKINTAVAKGLLEQIKEITPKPVNLLVISHSDIDHIDGVDAFPPEVAIIAQGDILKEPEGKKMLGQSKRAIIQVKEKDRLRVNGQILEFLHYAPAHTMEDLIVYLPMQKIVLAQDVLTMDLPFQLIHLDEGGSTDGWVKTMQGILALDSDLYLPGHGTPANKEAVKAWLAKAQDTQAKVTAMAKEGKTLDQIKAALNEKPVEGFGGYKPPSLTEVVYQEATKKPEAKK